MVVETIYVVRHAFRMNYNINSRTGEYYATGPSPTGIPTDPVLTAHGQNQARELAAHLAGISPSIDEIYCSPYYRCLQTLLPTTDILFAPDKAVSGAEDGSQGSDQQKRAGKRIKIETGFSEFLGRAWFKHPRPATLKELDQDFFPNLLDTRYKSVAEPDEYGETIQELHDRIAYALHKVIEAADALGPEAPKTILICSHAACIIAIGRALTGRMPSDEVVDDFQCYTAGLSTFRRRGQQSGEPLQAAEKVPMWDWKSSGTIPRFEWQGGKGVMGGWDCVKNSDCSFLEGGPERGWHFSGDESFLANPNGYNDTELAAGNSAGKRSRL